MILILAPTICAQSKTATQSSRRSATGFFEPNLKVRQKIATIFSKTVSYEGGGIDPNAGSIGGTEKLEVEDNSPLQPVFKSWAHYDGQPVREALVEFRSRGQLHCKPKTDECRTYLDDSGPLFDAFLWGDPPSAIQEGQTWNVQLSKEWELGPPGDQTVTVVAVDPGHRQVTLKREGSGSGWFKNDQHQMKITRGGKEYTVAITPGEAHWVGFSSFREGVTVSDELLETRTLTISSKEFGTATITERQFTILNQAPTELL